MIDFMPATMYGEAALVVKKNFTPAHQKRIHLACADGSFLFERKDKEMPRPLIDVNGPEYQATLHGRAMYRLYGNNYKDMMWAEETLSRLEKKLPFGDYTPQDHADFLKVKDIHARVFAKARTENGETAEHHTTKHYIWRTRKDGRVRPEHAKNEGLVFSWENPPPTGHPGEDFGCRCSAEPYTPRHNLEEKSYQILTRAAQDKIPAWTHDDFFNHYKNGDGKGVLLSEIGHLQSVINSAKVKVFPEVEEQIYEKARRLGDGTYPYRYIDSYSFHLTVFHIGGATVSREGQMTVTEQGDFLIVKANIDYHFHDRFTDPYDLINVTDGEYDPQGTKPYDIDDTWSTYIDAIIKKDSQQSKFPTP